jgi:carbonic anhydrase/acetyltransferase-like protein (isoleucine patch superfamily)
VVMDRAVIQSGAMVAAGALVTPGTVVPTGQLWSGAPARHMRGLTEAERSYMAYAAGHYVKLAAEHRALCGGLP